MLVDAVRARPELADRADRCRAVLNDLLAADASHARREVGLVCAAVEDGVPAALRVATTAPEVDEITTRFRASRALTPEAARWAVVTWTDTMRSLGWSSAPSSVVEPDVVDQVPGDLTGNTAAVAVPGDLTSELPDVAATDAVSPSTTAGLERRDRSRRRAAWLVGAAIVAVGALLAGGLIAVSSSGSGSSDERAAARPVQEVVARSGNDGLSVVRTWRIARDDPHKLDATIGLTNTSDAAISTVHLEPLPTDSLKRISFRPTKVRVLSTPGLARFTVTVPPGSTVRLGYRAVLTKQRRARAKSRMADLQGEISSSLSAAQPTPEDLAAAAYGTSYRGTLVVTEESADGVNITNPALGRTDSVSLTLKMPSSCAVASRGCTLEGTDNYRTSQPGAFKASGNSLSATARLDAPNELAVTCSGAPMPTTLDYRWAVEPLGARLDWNGWVITKLRYTRVLDKFTFGGGTCHGGTVHTLYTGELTG